MFHLKFSYLFSTNQIQDFEECFQEVEQQQNQNLIQCKYRIKNIQNQLIQFDELIKSLQEKIEKCDKLIKPIIIQQQNPPSQLFQMFQYTTKGRRNINEDSDLLVSITSNNQQRFQLMAIFDGHGGTPCSEFCKDNFVNNFMQNKFTKMNQIQLAISEAIIQTDQQFCKQFFHLHQIGSTAAVIVIDLQQNILYYQNVGDTRILIGTKSSYVQSVDHKPNNIYEQQRLKNDFQSKISELYGIQRVNGYLSISRSIGDPSYKIYGVVSQCQQYKPINLDEVEYTLIGSDGLFDILQNNVIDQIIRSCLNLPIKNQQDINQNEKLIIQAAIDLYNIDCTLQKDEQIKLIKQIDKRLISIGKIQEINQTYYDNIQTQENLTQQICFILCHIAYILGSIDNITAVISFK